MGIDHQYQDRDLTYVPIAERVEIEATQLQELIKLALSLRADLPLDQQQGDAV